MNEIGISLIPIAYIATSLVSLLNGALFGLLGYTLYAWIQNKVGINYKGAVAIVEQ